MGVPLPINRAAYRQCRSAVSTGEAVSTLNFSRWNATPPDPPFPENMLTESVSTKFDPSCMSTCRDVSPCTIAMISCRTYLSALPLALADLLYQILLMLKNDRSWRGRNGDDDRMQHRGSSSRSCRVEPRLTSAAPCRRSQHEEFGIEQCRFCLTQKN